MPFNIIRTKISDISPATVGGIINANKGEVIFKYNEVSNVTSSTTAACFFIKESKLNIENSCFTRCAGNGANEAFGNIADIQSTTAKINSISAFQCSFSTTQNADSAFRFLSCSALINHYNSSYCYGKNGAVTIRTDSNTSIFDVRYMTCIAGIDCFLIECWNIVSFEKSSFINSTRIIEYSISAVQGSIFDTCYFFQMPATVSKRIRYKVSLINCCSDDAISGYTLTVYSNTNDAVALNIKKPICKGALNCTCKRYTRKQSISIYFVIITLIS